MLDIRTWVAGQPGKATPIPVSLRCLCDPCSSPLGDYDHMLPDACLLFRGGRGFSDVTRHLRRSSKLHANQTNLAHCHQNPLPFRTDYLAAYISTFCHLEDGPTCGTASMPEAHHEGCRRCECQIFAGPCKSPISRVSGSRPCPCSRLGLCAVTQKVGCHASSGCLEISSPTHKPQGLLLAREAFWCFLSVISATGANKN